MDVKRLTFALKLATIETKWMLYRNERNSIATRSQPSNKNGFQQNPFIGRSSNSWIKFIEKAKSTSSLHLRGKRNYQKRRINFHSITTATLFRVLPLRSPRFLCAGETFFWHLMHCDNTRNRSDDNRPSCKINSIQWSSQISLALVFEPFISYAHTHIHSLYSIKSHNTTTKNKRKENFRCFVQAENKLINWNSERHSFIFLDEYSFTPQVNTA